MRYSQYLAQTNVRHKTVSYNLLTPKPVDGDADSLKPKKIEMTLKSAGNLLGCGLRARRPGFLLAAWYKLQGFGLGTAALPIGDSTNANI